MYGIPLTIYLLGSLAGLPLPAAEDTHAGGHLWNDLTGWTGDPHLSPFHLASYVAIGAGFWLIAAAWQHLHEAAQARPSSPPPARTRGYGTRSTTASSW